MTPSTATAKMKRLCSATALNASLLAASAVMVVPFTWMLTVSLKERWQVFAEPNFIPKVEVDMSKMGDPVLLVLFTVLLIVLMTRLLRGKKLARSLALPSVALAIGLTYRAFFTGFLSGPVFSAYVSIWSRIPFFRMFVNSLIVAVLTTLLQLFTSSLAGYAFSRLNFPGRDRLFWAYAALMMIPQQATLIPAFMLIHKMGLMDTYAALVLPFAAAPFGAFLMRQFFMALPKEIEEAAALDGCGRFSTLFRIFMPLAKPGLATLALFSFMTSWNEFMWPLMVTTRKEMFTLQVGLDMLKWEAGSDWPIIMAASVLVTLPVIAAFLAAQGRFTQSIAMSGINQ